MKGVLGRRCRVAVQFWGIVGDFVSKCGGAY